jgi:hypothetical protein
VLEAPDPESHRHDDGEEEAAMGFAITIGHAEEIETGDSEIPSYLGVRPVEREDAPAFDLDEHTGRSSRREVSYVAWDRFCRQTGLRDLFFDPRSGLMREHPGCAPITFEHVAIVEGAIAVWKKSHPDARPGWCDGQDEDLARLLWLASWMHWALEHCERPALANR